MVIIKLTASVNHIGPHIFGAEWSPRVSYYALFNGWQLPSLPSLRP